MALAARSRRGSRLPDWAGSSVVWVAGGAALAVMFVALAVYVLIPRDFYTGTNSTSTRSIIGDLASGQRMCVPGLALPAGTGQVRFNGGAGGPNGVEPARTVDVEVITPERTYRGTLPGAALPGPGAVNALDVPIGTVTRSSTADVCITPHGGKVWIGGMVGRNGAEPAPTLDGALYDNRVALWFLPPAGERKSLLELAPQIFSRLAVLRPGIVGPWTYWLLFLVGLPALAVGSIALLARAAADRPARLPRALAVWLIGFACAGSFALITPLFQTPDEGEHFAAVQYLAETGNAVDRVQGPRPAHSSQEGFALDATGLFAIAENPNGKPPWTQFTERRWLQRVRDNAPSRSNGGGFAIATSAHSPLYYTVLAPAYLAVKGQSLPSQLTAVRLVSSALGALVAMFAFLLVREILPRQPWAAVAAGLIVAFQPMFGFISGAINNDNGINAVAAALAYVLIRGLRRGLTWRLAITAGALLAIAPLMKGTGYFLYPVAALAALGMLVRGRDRRTVLAVLGIGGSLIAVTALWALIAPVFGRTLLTAPSGNDPTADVLALRDPVAYASYVWQLFFPPIPGTDMLNIYAQRVPAMSIYIVRGWGAFGWYAILFPRWLFVLIGLGVTGFGVLGLVTLWRFRAFARRRAWEIGVLIAIPVCVFLGVEAVYATDSPRPIGPVAEQGRYIFPAAAALAACAVGACFAFGRRLALPIATVLVVAIMGLSLYGRLLEAATFFS